MQQERKGQKVHLTLFSPGVQRGDGMRPKNGQKWATNDPKERGSQRRANESWWLSSWELLHFGLGALVSGCCTASRLSF